MWLESSRARSFIVTEQELQEKLKQIEQAVKEAENNPKKEVELLEIISDPQDANQCEGCQ